MNGGSELGVYIIRGYEVRMCVMSVAVGENLAAALLRAKLLRV